MPLSSTKRDPVLNEESSEARNATISATSSGRPERPCLHLHDLVKRQRENLLVDRDQTVDHLSTDVGRADRVDADAVCRGSSIAQTSVRPITAALDAQ